MSTLLIVDIKNSAVETPGMTEGKDFEIRLCYHLVEKAVFSPSARRVKRLMSSLFPVRCPSSAVARYISKTASILLIKLDMKTPWGSGMMHDQSNFSLHECFDKKK